ncbi:hypothetical protein [Streptomyces sp. KL116D]|uniref:hypothetical protein n=1 Tax=Streptomyces sp. KL116D TaxID=3045152 RepID=UPI003558D2D4
MSRELVQSQVYLAMLDEADASKRAVTRLVLTATAAQRSLRAVGGRFPGVHEHRPADTDVAA